MSYRLLKLTGHQASTFPGKVMHKIAPNILGTLAADKKILVVTGTNGKTTTAMMTTAILRALGYKVACNAAGANLAWGLSTCLVNAGDADVAVLEIDEAVFAREAAAIRAHTVLVTNIFNDQLDRYGSITNVRDLIEKGINTSDPSAVVLCGDDPLVATLGQAFTPTYFGLATSSDRIRRETREDSEARQPLQSDEARRHRQSGERGHAQMRKIQTVQLCCDTTAGQCPICGTELTYLKKTVGHLGLFRCPACGYERAEADDAFSFDLDSRKFSWHGHTVTLPLEGLYNAYNAAAALSASCQFADRERWDELRAITALETIEPSFGRQERIALDDGKSLCFVLVKNPAGFEQAMLLVERAGDVGGILFSLNNYPADGEDISWIREVRYQDFSVPEVPIGVSGICRDDMAQCLYDRGIAADTVTIADNAGNLTVQLIEKMAPGRCLYILPNYTAMIELRAQLAKRHGFNTSWMDKR